MPFAFDSFTCLIKTIPTDLLLSLNSANELKTEII